MRAADAVKSNRELSGNNVGKSGIGGKSDAQRFEEKLGSKYAVKSDVGICGTNASRTAGELSAAEKKLWSTGFLVFLLILWQALAMLIGKSFLLPSPFKVLQCLVENRTDIFLKHFPATLEVIVAGGILAVLIGAAFAVAMDFSPVLERAIYPILTVSQTIPTMCVAPVFVLWFGYTLKMRIIVVILVNFFTVTVNLRDGFASAKQQRIELMQTYGAGRFQIFYMLKMPSALPYFFNALRVSVPWSVIGAAVAEWLGAPSGLGTYSRTCMMNMDAAGLLAPLVVLTVFALLLTGLLNIAEKKLLTWRDDA